MLPLHVALVSLTDGVDIASVTRVCAALQKQVLRDLAPLWGVSATVDPFVELEDVPLGYWPMIVDDDIRASGVEGIHQDQDGQPFSLIQAGPTWSLTASHECLEMLVDPYGRRMQAGDSIKPGQGRVEYLVEVCDPCETLEVSYTVNGVVVSDFYTPSYLNPVGHPGETYSFTGAIAGPHQVLKGGYLSWVDPPTRHWWQAVFFAEELEFRDLGALPGVGGNFRAAIDRVTSFERLAPELIGLVDPADERLQAPRAMGDQAATSARSKAAAWRRQIADLKAGFREEYS